MKRKWVYFHGTPVEVDPYAINPPRKGPNIQTGAHYDYDCPITGMPVTSKHEHRENLKRHGCRVLESGETRQEPQRREESFNQKNKKLVETAVADVAKEMDF